MPLLPKPNPLRWASVWFFTDNGNSCNTTHHSGINTTPFERCRDSCAQARRPRSREWLDECFFNRVMRKPVHEALRQRITVHYNFSGLSDAEVAAYIRHKIACAGGAETIIDPPALSAVHSHSQGNPRVIDNLMTQALLLGQQLDKKVIDPELILAAVSDLNLL